MLTPNQIEQRLNYVTGTDASIICGMNPYTNIVDLFLIKTRQKVAPDISGNPHVKAGNYLEDAVVKMFCDETNIGVFNLNTTSIRIISSSDNLLIKGGAFISKKHPWMAANIDRLLDNGAILECKTAANTNGWGEPGDETTIPKHYLLQCAHYCAVTEKDLCYIAVLFRGVDFRIYKYHRNLDLEEKLIERERIFWEEHVLKNICPEPTTENEVKSMLMDLTEEPLVADEENNLCNMISVYSQIKENIKKLEIEMQEVKDVICSSMKEKQYLVDPFGKPLATWKQSKPVKRFDNATLKKEMPEIYDKYIVESDPIRTFRLKEEK